MHPEHLVTISKKQGWKHSKNKKGIHVITTVGALVNTTDDLNVQHRWDVSLSSWQHGHLPLNWSKDSEHVHYWQGFLLDSVNILQEVYDKTPQLRWMVEKIDITKVGLVHGKIDAVIAKETQSAGVPVQDNDGLS